MSSASAGAVPSSHQWLQCLIWARFGIYAPLPETHEEGDIIEASHIRELHGIINNLERGKVFWGGLTGASSSAYALTLDPAPDNPYQDGMIVVFKVQVTNTGAVTLNVNSVGARPLRTGNGTALSAGALSADKVIAAVYDSQDSGGMFKILSGTNITLNSLADVVISNPSSGQVVRHNGTSFVNANLTASDVPGGVDAAKIGGGAVSNTEFGYLDGVTSPIQTQLDGKASNLDNLSDVTISSPTSGQVVRHNGSNFVNANLTASDMPTGIDAARIGGGAVSNTEFGYLDGVTSAIQTQLNGKAASNHTHAASDITSGVFGTARLGTGSPSSSTFLRGDGSWAAVGGSSIPVGSVIPYAGASAPSGWLLCAGQYVSQSTYNDLYVALGGLGSPYGVNGSSQTFAVPDLRGRVVAGKDNMGGSSANRLVNMVSGGTLGQFGGVERHQLQLPEIPSHQHGIPLHATGGGWPPVIQGGWSNGYWNSTVSDAAGGGGYHTNTQPTLVLNYIIYAGV